MSAPDGSIMATATHGIILATAAIGMVSALLGLKRIGQQSEKLDSHSEKLDKIEIRVNGGLAEAVENAVKAALKKGLNTP